MATIKRFEDLEMWKISRTLCHEIGDLIDKDKLKQNYRLIGQVEGSSGSIMDNIAEDLKEGQKRNSLYFLDTRRVPCGEFRSQLYRLLDRKYIDQEQFEEFSIKAKRINAMIQKFIEYLRSTNIKGLRQKTANL